MKRSRIRPAWLASVSTLSFLAILVLSPVATQAKPPGWGFTSIVAVPGTVTPGRTVAFDVTITNGGKSNISSLLMATDLDADDPLAVPVYVGDAEWTGQPSPLVLRPCGDPPYATALSCDFGSLVARASVKIRIAFDTPETGSSWSFNFGLTGNGNTPSDSGTSHGDTKLGEASVNLSEDADYAGGFVIDAGESFSTSDTLTKQNPQSARLVGSQDLAIATIQESSSVTGAGTLCREVNCIGQWATITAPNPDNARITGSLLVLGKGIPGSVGPEDIVLYHLGSDTGDDGIIGDQSAERCASADDSASAPCIYVTKEGQNFRITFWLLHNGSLRGSW